MFGLKKPIETSEHTQSYYVATANNCTQYPHLEGQLNTDVVVVGGGFSGVNTALELAEKGFQVVLLEANRIGWGATGRNGGQVIGGIGHGHERFAKQIGATGIQALYDMGVECVDIVRQRVHKYAIDCDLTMGYMDVALKPAHMRDFEADQRHMESMGYAHPLQLLDNQQVREEVGSDNYIGGLLDRTGNGHCHVLNLCLGEAAAAADLGVKIYEQTRVTHLQQGRQPIVTTEAGQVKAKHVVLCGNAYLGNLVPKLNRRILPANSSVVTTRPLSQTQLQDLIPNNLAICDPRTALDYYRLTADGRLLFGGLSNYTGREPSNLLATMQNKIHKVFPQLQGVELDYGWSGQMGIGINRMPQLGRLDGNVYYVQAYAGHGVAPTHIMGRIIAEMIAGQAERFDIFGKIKHHPFPGGQLLRTPSFALAMLYYKLKDELL
ncbi:MAG: FAD-binding oxidoreductase [Gammaproteobacteria bacterium]|jgi:hypothetical protein|nr:FAD-binding oxidoreductase [Gammaproteobacteria bacterium]